MRKRKPMRYQLHEKKALLALLLLLGSLWLFVNTTVLEGPVRVSERGGLLLLLAAGATFASVRLFRSALQRQ